MGSVGRGVVYVSGLCPEGRDKGMEMEMMKLGFPQAMIMSFGYKHGLPARDHAHSEVLDVRVMFPDNPHRFPHLRDLDGLDCLVGLHVVESPGFCAAYEALTEWVIRVLEKNPEAHLYLGCSGGRHRSVYLAARLAREWGMRVEHRDKDRMPRKARVGS